MHKQPLVTLLACTALTVGFVSMAVAQEKPKSRKARFAVEEIDGLPRVLLLGDSISMGYTRMVQESMQGKANVLRPESNCSCTAHTLEQLDEWLGEGTWDVIHFNWGLHDLKWLADGETNLVAGKLVEPGTGYQVAAIDEYQANLEKLLTRLEKTGAALIWRTTTPVPPEGARGRRAGDSVVYNRAASEVVARHPEVLVDDLYALAKRLQPTLKSGDGNVHFKPQASQQFADQVAAAIEKALSRR